MIPMRVRLLLSLPVALGAGLLTYATLSTHPLAIAGAALLAIVLVCEILRAIGAPED